MNRKVPFLLVLLASFTPLLASAGNLINDNFNTTDIAFDVGGVETVTAGNHFSTTPADGCPVEYAVPLASGSASVDVLEPNHFFGPAVNFFGGATTASSLETSLVTVVGETYTIAFTLKQIGTLSDHKIVATAGGATTGPVGPGSHRFSFIASDTSTPLTFSGIICTVGTCNAGSDIALDSLVIDTTADVINCEEEEPILDADADGVVDLSDLCPATKAGSSVDGAGCSIAQYCGCDDFRKHGQYVSCTARTTEAFLQDGIITELEKTSIIRTAAKSSCGKPEKKSKKHWKHEKHSDKSDKHSKKYKRHSYKMDGHNTKPRKHKNKRRHSDKKSGKSHKRRG